MMEHESVYIQGSELIKSPVADLVTHSTVIVLCDSIEITCLTMGSGKCSNVPPPHSHGMFRKGVGAGRGRGQSPSPPNILIGPSTFGLCPSTLASACARPLSLVFSLGPIATSLPKRGFAYCTCMYYKEEKHGLFNCTIQDNKR